MTNNQRELFSKGMNQNSFYTKIVIESYVCISLNYQWLDSNIKGIDGHKDGVNLEIKAVNYKPSICQIVPNKSLYEILSDEIVSDKVALYFGERNETLDSNKIKVLNKNEFIEYLYHRVVIDKDSQKNGGGMKLRFTNNYRTNAMTEKMKSLGLL